MPVARVLVLRVQRQQALGPQAGLRVVFFIQGAVQQAPEGFGVLRQFAVTYDLPGDALYFERYLNFGTPDIADRGGLWLERGADGYEVIDVVAAGPAAQAGLKAGDVIVDINGRPWSEVALPALRDALRAPPGSRVRMKTKGGTEVTLVLRDLV